MEDVLEATVHSLSKEGHNGVGCVTQQDHSALGVPLSGSHSAQKTIGVGQHLLHSTVNAANLVQSLEDRLTAIEVNKEHTIPQNSRS